MTEEEKTAFFIELYMAAIRSFYSNEFLKPPNPSSDRYDQLNEARKIVDKIGGEYSEYIRVVFETYKKFHTAPKPAHLIAPNTIKRYRAWQKKYNKFNTKEYTLNGNYFTVSKTRKVYPSDQVDLPVSQDATALTAFDCLKAPDFESIPEERKVEYEEALYYLVAKLKYKGAIIPQSVKDFMEKIGLNYR